MENSSAATSMPFHSRIGTQIIGPRYAFTEEGPLVEAARQIYDMGSDVIKITLTPASYQIEDTNQSLADIALGIPEFRTVLDMPFAYFQLWAGKIPLELDTETERALYDELYALASALLTTYTGSGKVFMIGNWEGDWILLEGYDAAKNPDPAKLETIRRVFALRQRAIEDARTQTPHEAVEVAHYIELNRPLDAKDRGLSRIANEVLPHVRADLVSYSAYDALWPNRLTEALDYIERQATFTDYFNHRFTRKVFVGEYDAYRDYHVHGYFSPQQQMENAYAVMVSALAWGAPFVLFWALYNNERERLIHGGGFYLIDDQNRKQPVYELHRLVLGRINAYNQWMRCWVGRDLHESELGRLTGRLTERPVSEGFELLLEGQGVDDSMILNRFCELTASSSANDRGHLTDRYYAVRQANGTRFEALLACLDDSSPEVIGVSDVYRTSLGLRWSRYDHPPTTSELWLEYLNSELLLGRALNRRRELGNEADWLMPFHAQKQIQL